MVSGETGVSGGAQGVSELLGNRQRLPRGGDVTVLGLLRAGARGHGTGGLRDKMSREVTVLGASRDKVSKGRSRHWAPE